ncbi:MAG: hypothetical protein WC151_04440 [Bacteroidales bacterium]|nr:hypothetical protein [Bacteroidales bacterium]
MRQFVVTSVFTNFGEIINRQAMKPSKNLEPIALWVMRTAMLLYAFTSYFSVFKGFQLNDVSFWFALVNLVFCGLLFVAGFTHSHELTLWSALIMVIVSIFGVVMEFPNGITANLSLYLLTGGVAALFFSRGNK